MEIQEFQEKLAQLCSRAQANGNVLKAEQVRDAFSGMDLGREELMQILKYLKSQGIALDGAHPAADEQESEPAKATDGQEKQRAEESAEEKAGKNPCLTEEDRAYLARYKESLKKEAGEGAGAMAAYLPLAADLAAQMYRDGMNLADLIQEANLALVNIFAGDVSSLTEKEICEQLHKGVQAAADEQDEQKFGDDTLVAKVQNLDSVMKELTERDEGDPKYSVEELAIMLDMDIDEMKDIIRLTGGDDAV